MKGTIVKTYTMQGRIYAKATNDMELTHSYCAVCSDDIHSQLEGNDWVSTLFDFCMNPSHEGTIVKTYTREGFMQKPQMIWNLPIHIVRCVVMIFIAN